MGDHARLDLVLDGLLHPGEVDRFVSLSVATEPGEFAALRERVGVHLAAVEQRHLADAGVDVEVARRVAAVLELLLDEPEAFDARGRALVRGAAEYFVLDDDDDADSAPGVGFDDDARVLNAALVGLGRDELRVEP
jgi:hypothetical protein